MMRTCRYESPLGAILLFADEEGITGMRFEHGSRHDVKAEDVQDCGKSPILSEAACWLDEYFDARAPSWIPLLHVIGSDFEKAVCAAMLKIPCGMTRTYGDIASELAEASGKRMSAQAVGGAVGRNPICIIIPCHRVMGAGGNLTGYGGGLDRKIALLKLEGAWKENFHLPKALKR
ncbi:MAG: methylated-DNA--[protein]-cysteine S-methyltransferase [Aeromonadales bacterium]|nr:methylated-DNA--[protein]-cysteine S-methyltransferase [Aeromonadales bacterium]MDY2891696.1 methylated-DNA--[protein]-cysteine S-methyltransferase [Succinivibrio sp.]